MWWARIVASGRVLDPGEAGRGHPAPWSGQAEEELLEFILFRGVCTVGVGEAFLECAGDDKEPGAVKVKKGGDKNKKGKR